MDNEQAPVDVNVPQLLAAIVIWLMQVNESFYDAAKRLGIPAVHVGPSKQVLIRKGFVLFESSRIHTRNCTKVRLIEKEENARQSQAWKYLMALLGEEGIQTGYIYDLERYAEWYYGRKEDGVGLFPTSEDRVRLRQELIPDRGDGNLHDHQRRLQYAKAFLELMLLHVNQELART